MHSHAHIRSHNQSISSLSYVAAVPPPWHINKNNPSLLLQDKAAATLFAFISAQPQRVMLSTGPDYPAFSKAFPSFAATISSARGLKRFVQSRQELTWQDQPGGFAHIGVSRSQPAAPQPQRAQPSQQAPAARTFEYVQDFHQAHAAMQRVVGTLDQERARGAGAGDPLMAVDIEGDLSGKIGARLSLIQIRVNGLPAMVFDALRDPQMMVNVSGLGRVLEDPTVVKVMHDCRKDAVALFGQLGVRLASVYDTQVTNTLLLVICCRTCFANDAFTDT
jgi:hypothetical protein